MNISVLLVYAAAAVTAALAVYVVSRDPKNPVSRFFAAGMVLLVMESAVSAAVTRVAGSRCGSEGSAEVRSPSHHANTAEISKN